MISNVSFDLLQSILWFILSNRVLLSPWICLWFHGSCSWLMNFENLLRIYVIMCLPLFQFVLNDVHLWERIRFIRMRGDFKNLFLLFCIPMTTSWSPRISGVILFQTRRRWRVQGHLVWCLLLLLLLSTQNYILMFDGNDLLHKFMIGVAAKILKIHINYIDSFIAQCFTIYDFRLDMYAHRYIGAYISSQTVGWGANCCYWIHRYLAKLWVN